MRALQRKQLGSTMWEIALYIGAAGLIFTCVMKLGPHYVDDNGVASAIKGVHENLQGKDIYEVSNTAIKSSLGKFFDVDMISSDILKQVDIKRDGGKVMLILDYEVREPFMGNVDVVLNFKHEVDLAAPLDK